MGVGPDGGARWWDQMGVGQIGGSGWGQMRAGLDREVRVETGRSGSQMGGHRAR